MSSNVAHEYKVVVLGSDSAGRSALTIKFVTGEFIGGYDPTIADSYRIERYIDEIPCVLEIVDIASTEQFSSMHDLYIKNGQGFIIVYSIINAQTFRDILSLRNHILKVKAACDSVPIVLVGNKLDLAEQQREVSIEEAASLALSWQCAHLETSAKNNARVNDVFFEIVRQLNRLEARGKSRRRTLSQGSAGSGFRKVCSLL